MAADACAHHGLILPKFSKDTEERLRSVVMRDITFNNPLDLTAGATANEFEGTLNILANEKDIDAILTIFIPPITVAPSIMENAVRHVIPVFQQHKKPMAVCFMGQSGIQQKLGASGKFIPCYPFPEEAVSALAKAARYGELIRKPKGRFVKVRGLKRTRARKIVENAMMRSTQRPLWLSPEEISELLDCYGIRLIETKVATTITQAVNIASSMGFPVVVKLSSSTIVHKTDVDGIILDVKSENEVKKAFRHIKTSLTKMDHEHEMDGVTIQPMVVEGIEAIIGVTHDPSFGPLIMFGLGGIYAELIKDISLRLHPLTNLDARELINSVKMTKMLDGYRGSVPSDTKALEDLLLRVSTLVEDIPMITELDLNPVKVMPQGQDYWIVDARIMVR